MKTEMYNILTSIVKNGIPGKKTVLYKGDEELFFLQRWLTEELAASAPVSQNTVEYLHALIEKCAKCNNALEKKYGFGSGINGVMIILNAPKLLNKLEKNVYKQESIDLLKKIVSSIQLQFNECYITNLAKCDVNDSLMKPSQIISNCSTVLNEEIKIINPHLVIVMGDIMPLQKIIKDSSKINWFNIEHPITLIKTPELKRNAWNTLQLVMEKVKTK